MSSSRDSFVLSVNLLFAGIIFYMFFQINFEMQFSMQFEWISLWMCVSILLDRRFIGTNTTVQANNNNSLHCRRKKMSSDFEIVECFFLLFKMIYKESVWQTRREREKQTNQTTFMAIVMLAVIRISGWTPDQNQVYCHRPNYSAFAWQNQHSLQHVLYNERYARTLDRHKWHKTEIPIHVQLLDVALFLCCLFFFPVNCVQISAWLSCFHWKSLWILKYHNFISIRKILCDKCLEYLQAISFAPSASN